MVLAVSERLLADLPATQEDDERSRGRRQQTAVLAVPAAQVARVVLASQAGDVRLALHRQSRSVALTTSEPISDAGSAAALAELLGTTGRSARRPSAATVKVHRADNLSEVSP
jgi:Flp pilus assembly protein CpaB